MKKLIYILILFSATVHAQEFRVHSHNDYVQDMPFYRAFNAGCASIEADLILENGILFVAHNKEDIKKENSLELLYLEPLAKILKDTSNSFSELQLLLDIKTDAHETLKEVIKVLDKYDVFTKNKSLRIVISGNRPAPEDYRNYPDYILFDYQSTDFWPKDLSKIALVSLPFYKFSFWNGKEINGFDTEKLQKVIKEIHSKGKMVRFWATPDTELAWETFHNLGIDFINTDQPNECVAYLKTIK
jgi:alkaline phosphatase